MSYQRLTQKQKVLAVEVSDLLNDAEAIDADEDARFGKDKRGDELPKELARRQSRLVKLAAAREQLEADAAEKARKDAKNKARERGDDGDEVTKKGDVAAKNAVVAPTAQRNFTDPDSRIMKTADGSFHYCYTGLATGKPQARGSILILWVRLSTSRPRQRIGRSLTQSRLLLMLVGALGRRSPLRG